MLLTIGLVIWALACLYFVLFINSTEIYSLTYYAADYTFGFVRRGLGGELVALVPGDYFTAARVVMWMPAAGIVIALAGLIKVILFRGSASERRVMLALLVPILPFSLAFYILLPRPELLAMSALIAFGIHQIRPRTPRSRMISSAVYGAAIAVLALIHEAIPVIVALGLVLVILVLAKDAAPRVQRICIGLAVVPGFVVALLIAGLGRRGAAAQLCGQLPHRNLDNPYAVPQPQVINFIMGRLESRSDYHDFACNVIKSIDSSFTDAVYGITQIGLSVLVLSSIVGLLIFLTTVWVISYISGVSVHEYCCELRRRWVLPTLMLSAWVPLFMTGNDWTRWWVLLTFNIVIVYILYATTRPEIDIAPPIKTYRVFIVIAILMAFPVGQNAHIGGPPFPSAKPGTAHNSERL